MKTDTITQTDTMTKTLLSPDSKVLLRDYQKQDVKELIKNLEVDRKVLYQLPTGGGKTTIALAVAENYLNNGKTIVWAVHRKELIKQAYDRSIAMGLPTHDSYPKNTYRPHHINTMSVGKLKNTPVPTDSVLIIDEAHHSFATGYARAISNHQDKILGVTATPWRMSKKQGFDHLYNCLVIGEPLDTLLNDGYLIKPDIFIPDYAGGMRPVNPPRDTFGEYRIQEMFEKNRTSYIKLPVMAAVRQILKNPESRIILYAVNQEAAYQIAHNIMYALYTDKPGKIGLLLHDDEISEKSDEYIETDREKVVAGFISGNIQIVINVAIITEGFDVPGADCAIIGRPTASLALFRQMVGRVMRPADGKTKSSIIDLPGNSINPEIGWPWAEYPWSLSPRSNNKMDDAILKKCQPEVSPDYNDSCSAYAYGAQQQCTACGLWFGKVCEKCLTFRHWKDWNTRYALKTGKCEQCNQDAILARRNAEEEKREKQRDENKKKNEVLKKELAYEDMISRWLLKEERDSDESKRKWELGSGDVTAMNPRFVTPWIWGKILNGGKIRLNIFDRDWMFSPEDRNNKVIEAIEYANENGRKNFPIIVPYEMGNNHKLSVFHVDVETSSGKLKKDIPVIPLVRYVNDVYSPELIRYTVCFQGQIPDLVEIVKEHVANKIMQEMGVTL